MSQQKNRFYKYFTIAILAVLLSTADFAFAKSAGGLSPFKLLASKYLIVMIAIAGSSILLYLGLSIYNKFFAPKDIKNFNLKNDSLKTPENTEEAVMMFIEKNRLK